MYEKVNFRKELKQIPQTKLVAFLASELKKNESLQKAFIEKFDITIQQKFIQDYIKECESEIRKYRRSIGHGEYVYLVSECNKHFIHPKISFLKTMIKKEQYLEGLKLCLALIQSICTISARNGRVEELGYKTTADRYENKLHDLEKLLITAYKNISVDEYHLFDRKTFFTILGENYSILLRSPIFNFIFIREHAKLEWLINQLQEEDVTYFEKFTNFK